MSARRIHAELTRDCYFRCPICYQRDYNKGTEAVQQKVFEFMSDPALCLDALLQGGEVWRVPNFADRLRAVKEANPTIKISTVSTLGRVPDIEQYRGLLDTIQVSLDTLDPVLHRKIRNWDLNDTLDNIQRFLSFGTRIFLVPVLTRTELRTGSYRALLTYVRENGIGLRYGVLVDMRRGGFPSDETGLTREELSPLVEYCRANYPEAHLSFVDGLSSSLQGEFDEEAAARKPRCDQFANQVYVDMLGEVRLCCLQELNPHSRLGNVTEHSIAWLVSDDNPAMRDIAEQWSRGKYLDTGCKPHCWHLGDCRRVST